jgi:hypothetical protein
MSEYKDFQLGADGVSARAKSAADAAMKTSDKSVQLQGESKTPATPKNKVMDVGNGRTKEMPVQESVAPISIKAKKI